MWRIFSRDRILYWSSECYSENWPQVHDSAAVLLGVSFGARRSNYGSVLHWERATGEVQPLSSAWTSLFHEEREAPVFTMTWMWPPSHWEGLAQDFQPLLACIRGIFVLIVDEFLHGSSAQEKLCLECAVAVTWFFLRLLVPVYFAVPWTIFIVFSKKKEVAMSSRWVYSDYNILPSAVNLS